ncbi:hypothetical protein FC093_07580 [Ilyomonas limi]|uniref:Uncharacterized protein n=1 Tax=Ilyomonas limi TaxID=2575867 RepID=A0A4U3L8A7_9BACT|nr:hypothetical protein [Ilyomonas limi]TKK69927.1 hypothetical protein FC093_07580 [Ilyomonas limi]
MKKLFIFASILLLAISCNTGKYISTSAIGLVNLQNYAAKSAIDLPYTYNYMVITNQQDFDNTFGIAKSGNINITYPGFAGQTVIACVAQPTTNNVTIHFDKAEVAGKELNVYCTTTEGSEHLKNAIIPVAVATVPKVMDVKKVVFYTNGEKVMTKAVSFKEKEEKEINTANENNTNDTKPVVLKRMMRRPAVI